MSSLVVAKVASPFFTSAALPKKCVDQLFFFSLFLPFSFLFSRLEGVFADMVGTFGYNTFAIIDRLDVRKQKEIATLAHDKTKRTVKFHLNVRQ